MLMADAVARLVMVAMFNVGMLTASGLWEEEGLHDGW